MSASLANNAVSNILIFATKWIDVFWVRTYKDIGTLRSSDSDASISIFQAGSARPPTISVLAGLRSPRTLLRSSRAAATSPWLAGSW